MQSYSKNTNKLKRFLRPDSAAERAIKEAAFGDRNAKVNVPLRTLHQAIDEGDLDVRIAAAAYRHADRYVLEKASKDSEELVRWAALGNPNVSCRQIVKIVREFYSKSAAEITSPIGTTFSYFLKNNPNSKRRNFALKCVKRYSRGMAGVIS